MNEHNRITDLLPLYISGVIEPEQRSAVEQHLTGCVQCREDLKLWQVVSSVVMTQNQAVTAPRGLAELALAQVAAPAPQPVPAWTRLLGLLRAQMPLVQREIWPASAAVIALGWIAALIAERSEFIYALAPPVSAACIAMIYGRDNDPAYELSLSTPTSPRQILLARLVLVYVYNLALVLLATLSLLPITGAPMLNMLAADWLAPMTFLSAAALALSMWIGPSNAIGITYVAWLARLVAGPMRSLNAAPVLQLSPPVEALLAAYQHFWQSPALLLALAAALLGAAIWLAGHQPKLSMG